MEKKISIAYIGSHGDIIRKLAANDNLTLQVLPNALTAMNYMNSGEKPDAILCENHVLGGSALEIFNILKSKKLLEQVSFILITFEFKRELFLEAFNNKFDDFYVLPDPEPEALVGRIKFLREYKSRFRQEEVVHVPAGTLKVPPLKRFFDIIIASFALLCLSPLLLIVILAIRLESKGKVYYISKRYGRFPFDFYKLRSMRTGADAEIDKLAKEKNQYSKIDKPAEIEISFKCPKCKWENDKITEPCSKLMLVNDSTEICEHWYRTQIALIDEIKVMGKKDYTKTCPRCKELGKKCSDPLTIHSLNDFCHDFDDFQDKVITRSKGTFIKISNDPRVTKVGKFIRNTSIDELPQLINVLKGDMSIVGNRPLPLNEAELLLKDSNFKRFMAPAGITGLWQVELRGKGGVMSEAERNRLDNDYAELFIENKYTLWYDIKLILRTVPALFQKDSV